MKFLAGAPWVGVAWAIVGFGVLAVPGMAQAHHPGGDAGGPWQSLGPFVFVFAGVTIWLVWTVLRGWKSLRRTRENDAPRGVEEADE